MLMNALGKCGTGAPNSADGPELHRPRNKRSAEIRAWVRDQPAQGHQPQGAQRAAPDARTTQRWARILGKQGWLGWAAGPSSSAARAGTAVQRHLFEEECALAGAPRIMPFGPVMVAPVIMAFGTPEQQRASCPASPAARCGGARATASPARARTWRPEVPRRAPRRLLHRQRPEDLDHAGPVRRLDLLPGAHQHEGKPQTGISFLLIDMKSPGITVRPIIMLDGGHEVNEVWFDNVEVPADNLIGEENKGWTYAKHLLSHERTNIADVNRAKRELERVKRIAKPEGVL
jgi:alkylation response protein AidB-like acyl-CoA dehydrogenase